MKINRIIAGMLFAGAILTAGVADACTNFLFTKGATKDGSTMITYAADSHTLYGELYYRRAADYPEGTMFMVYDWDSGRPLIEIPQVAHTYNVVGNMNEHQLAIGETTYGGRKELHGSTGIDYGSLIYLTLQRAKNAREAIKTIAELMDTYGYASSGESFSICDPNEVWIMELIGKGKAQYDTIKGKQVLKKGFKDFKEGAVWVARRVPDGYVCGHANQARITTFPLEKKKNYRSITSRNMKYIFNPEVECVYSDDVISFARAKGYFSGKDEEFSFADAYCPLDFSGMRGCDARVYAMFARVKNGIRDQYADYALGRNPKNRLPLWIKPDHKVDVHEVMNLMRDHYEGTPLDMTQDVGAGPFKLPYRWRPMDFKVGDHSYVHERATSTQQTGFSFVAQCRGWLPNPVGGIIWFGVDDTYTTVYCPMYCCITEIPECFREGNGSLTEYSETSAFWLFNRVSNFAYLRYCDMIVDIQRTQDDLETSFIRDVEKNDKRVSNANQAEIVTLNNDFSNRMAAKMMRQWKELDHFLLMKYIDGNVKHATNGKLDKDQYGHCVWPDQPKYPDWFYKQIVDDHGDVIIEK